MELDTMTATSALAAMRRGELGSEELLDAQLARLERDNARLGLVVALDERARSQCRAADDARVRGDTGGPLHGLPMTVKDAFETSGLVTTAGARALAGHVPRRDAAAVAALRRAGAVVHGKTNLPPYAADFQTCSDLHGLSRNPWDPSRTTGGSSGGAAGALASGMTLLELGSDIGGSIRCPAHYTGVTGHKPTWGAVATSGHIPGPPGAAAPVDLGVVGPMGRTVEDLQLAMTVLTSAGAAGVPRAALPPSTAPRSWPGLRVGLWVEDAAAPTSREVTAALRRLADRMADAGAVVTEDARPGPGLDEITEVYLQLLMAVMTTALTPSQRAGLQDRARHPSADLFTRAHARGAGLTHADWQAADEQRHRLGRRWARLFEQVDVVLAPCSPGVAFPHDVDRPPGQRTLSVDGREIPYLEHVVWSGLASLPGLPATAVPVTRSQDGLPIGAQVIGPRWGDRTTLHVASLVTELTGGFVPPPRVPSGRR